MTDMAFVAIGEKIHCTRSYRKDGKMVEEHDGRWSVVYTRNGERRFMPIPAPFLEDADWQNGKVRHCAAAVWNGLYGDEPDAAAAKDFIQALVESQEAQGAAFLEVNVDQFSNDEDEKIKAMEWAVHAAQAAGSCPLSIDSSSPAILKAGLAACDPSRGRPMLNSVSLERLEPLSLIGEYKCVVIASAAGKEELPNSAEERLANLQELLPMIKEQGAADADIYIDPLVFPIATDQQNGVSFIESVRAIREAFGPDIHIGGGLSNVSFGMPRRNLINIVFARLCVDAGADSGIVDPAHINASTIASLDCSTVAYELARALLMGEDEFGMEFITASRDGRL